MDKNDINQFADAIREIIPKGSYLVAVLVEPTSDGGADVAVVGNVEDKLFAPILAKALEKEREMNAGEGDGESWVRTPEDLS